MNPSEDQIESVLRHAPRPQPPAGLRGQLVQGIPQARSDRVDPAPARFASPWWQRWWPTLAAGSAAGVGLVVLAVQQVEIRGLSQELQELQDRGGRRSGTVAGDMVPGGSPAPLPTAVVPQANGAAETERLRATVQELTAEVAALQAMKAENEQLRAQALAATGLDAEAVEALTKAREKAQRIACVNNLKQLGLAGRIWANDNGDILPPDILSMSNEIAAPKVLICPADEGRQPAADWSSFTAANVSYEYLAASGDETEPQRVMFLCPIHNNVTLCDGSVQQLTPERRAALIQRDGKLYLGEPTPARQIDPQTGMDRRMMERYGLLPSPASEGSTTSAPLMPEEMMERYGLAQPAAPATQPAAVPLMSEELMRRYGLMPAPTPDTNEVPAEPEP